jgi:hypothetical protein
MMIVRQAFLIGLFLAILTCIGCASAPANGTADTPSFNNDRDLQDMRNNALEKMQEK